MRRKNIQYSTSFTLPPGKYHLKFVVREDARLPQLNTVWVPEGVDEAQVRSRLLNEFGIEIGAGLGALAGRVWRIGLMGHSSRPANIALCLAALEAVIRG